MVFKDRRFNGEAPEEVLPGNPALLETAVAETLSAVADLDASDVAVIATGASVVLAGAVGSREEAIRAVQAAATVDGVRAVDDRLTYPPAAAGEGAAEPAAAGALPANSGSPVRR
ncbi:BON domain-containing protein [Rhizobium sp. TRM95111]|uniref:BON domain-containing protein n=1 Tax=Rhizobium alarense TaxID=2846851 RepID=UPI001F40D590|nr:BON domain-containing protein [Rhizobium alarense]MCF3638357.1 BON domain-containing protein [Rhizobium alarense]